MGLGIMNSGIPKERGLFGLFYGQSCRDAVTGGPDAMGSVPGFFPERGKTE